MDPEDKLVILDATHSSLCCSFCPQLVAVYAPNDAGQSDKFRDLGDFLETSRTLVLVGDFNTILDCVVSTSNRKGNSCLCNLLSRLQLVYRFKMDHTDASMWTWTNSSGSFRFYSDKEFIRFGNISSVSYPQVHIGSQVCDL